MGVQWLRLALSKGSNRVGVSLHLRIEADPFSETFWFSSDFLESGRGTKSETPVILCVIHHRQNSIASTSTDKSVTHEISKTYFNVQNCKKKYHINMGFEVPTPVTVKIRLWDVEPCSLVPTFRMNLLPPSSPQSLLLTIYSFTCSAFL
jgi:hypothetical protein